MSAKAGKENKMQEEIGVDSQSLELVIEKEKKKPKKREFGGAMTRNFTRRNF